VALTDKQIREEEEFLKGIPRFNLAAFLLPPIWGPVHGFWVTLLFYPLWLFVDNMLYAVYTNPAPFTVILAVVVILALAAGTAAFSVVSQPLAYHRAAARGLSKEQYLKRQRIWAVVCAILGIAMLAFATYYNLEIRTEL